MTTLITGGARGLGRALVENLSAAGEPVIATHRGAVPEALASGARWLKADMTDAASLAALGPSLGETAVDTLICNAGLLKDRHQDIDSGYPPELWAEMFAVNVTGVFLTVQALLPALRRAKGAKIAIISSQMGSSTRASGGSLIYRASKAAAVNLGRNLAVELKGQGISVGIYHPGWVQTDMGGPSAAITPAQSAAGLIERIHTLGPATTGCFETWDGTPFPF
ncbi:SDR family oxidoreductase [Solirhodobacter olei]|uniref:SDR family oxidoreductase n=1 Tax=Solirhodobacter olei TaxID=2493082 RepID=UPI000FD88787|nr:SDR family oxidoreductase [Solirhodobacter olei]